MQLELVVRMLCDILAKCLPEKEKPSIYFLGMRGNEMFNILASNGY